MVTTILEVGTEIPDLRHGQRQLPLGTLISIRRTDRYRLVAPATWLADSVEEVPMDPVYYSYPVMLAMLPDGARQVPWHETTEQFRWRLRDLSLTAAERSGVSINRVEACLSRLDAGPQAFELGEGLTFSNEYDMRRLPVGSLVYCGHPSRLECYAMYRVSEPGVVTHVLGKRNTWRVGFPFRVFRSAPTPPWWTAEPDEEDELNLKLLRSKAWQVGMAGKRSNSWCSVVEHTLHSLGVSAGSTLSVGDLPWIPGDVLSCERVASMPEGTVFGWAWGNGTGYYTVYVRDDRSRARSRTTRIWGTDLSHDNGRTELIYLGPNRRDLSWMVPGRALATMPHGTRYSLPDSEDVFSLTEDSALNPHNIYRLVALP